jgi:hypothetical protein
MPADQHPRQIQLPMLTYYDGPRMIDQTLIDACPTYREAVRNCWTMRTRTRMTKRQLAEEVGCYASHVTDYLSDDPSRRDLPARHIADFELSCGNRFVSQWIARRSDLTVLEEFVARRQGA